MARPRETSTDRGNYADIGAGFVDDKKPSWVNLAHLDAPMEDSLANRLIYKPALRFHGLTGGIWGAGALSDTPSLPSDRPPSYKMVESLKSKPYDGFTDVEPIYNTGNITAISPLTLRKRNTMAVVVVAIALLAAAATITGVALHYLHPKSLLRANVRFTIANRNFSDEMVNTTSMDFHAIEQTLCEEMDDFFLTSELADFYLGCKVVSLRNDDTRVKNGTAVHFNLDFIENSVSNDGERIKAIIMRRSGRHKTDDTLYLVIRDFLVYLRSLRVDLEVLPLPDDHPGRTRARIPWNRDIDFISSKSSVTNKPNTNGHVLMETNQLTEDIIGAQTLTFSSNIGNVDMEHKILAEGATRHVVITPRSFHLDATPRPSPHVMYVSTSAYVKPVLLRNRQNMLSLSSMDIFNKAMLSVGEGFVLTPTKTFSEQSMGYENRFNKVTNVHTANLNSHHKYQAEKAHQGSTLYYIKQSETGDSHNEQNDIEHFAVEEQPNIKRFVPEHIKLQTSFEDISANKDDINNFATETLLSRTRELNTDLEHVSESVSSKIMTLSSDTFLIQGSKVISHDEIIEADGRLNDVLHHVPINYVPVLNEIEVGSVDITRAKAKLKKFKSSVITTPIDDTVPMESVDNSQLVSLSKDDAESTHPLSLAKRMDASDPLVVQANAKVQLNEFVEVPLARDPIHPPHENVEWINILNEPLITDLEPVGSSPEQVPFTQNEHEHVVDTNVEVHLPVHEDHQRVVNVQVGLDLPTNLQNGLILDANSDMNVYNQPPDAEWINIFNEPQETTLQFVGNLRDTRQNDIKSKKSKIELVDSNTQQRHDPGVSVVVRDEIPPLRNNDLFFLDNGINNDAHVQSPERRQEHGSFLDDAQYVPEDYIRSNPVNEQVTPPPNMHEGRSTADNTITVVITNGNIGNVRRSETLHRLVTNNVPNFEVVRTVIDGRSVLVLRKIDTGDRFLLGEPSAMDGQTWAFLQNIGFNTTTSAESLEPVNTHTNRLPLDPVNTQTNIQLHVNTQNNRLLHDNVNINVATQSQRRHSTNIFRGGQRPSHDQSNPRQNIWRQSNIIGRRHWSVKQTLGTNRNGPYPNIHMSHHRGFPKSGTFDDIEEMKEILRHLVETMRDMTGKLDSLQSAVNFINTTFHERHEPIFNLQGVLKNMTVSLDNMNGNLKTINQTLKDFKDFLKQFRGTLFNSDDVIRHIDESIKNLGKTVVFIESSVLDLNGTASSISDKIFDVNSTLAFANNSAWDVNYTSTYSNDTLDSMVETLESLDKAVDILNIKFNTVTGGVDIFGVSLRNINQTVKNTHEKLEALNGKLTNFNASLNGVTQQVDRLNETYRRINKTLESLNESYMFTNGTVLDVITKLADMDVKLNDLNGNVHIINSNISSMNSSLLGSLDSLIDLVHILTEFNLRIEENNNSIVIDLKHKDLLETVRMLLNMNGTLSEIGQNVDDINERIDLVDYKLGQLEQRLADLDTTLDTIDATFKILNETLRSMNHTVGETTKSLAAMDSTLTSMNSTFNEISVTFGNIDDTLDTVNKTLTKVRDTSDEMNSTIIDAHQTFLDLRENMKATNKSTNKLNGTISKIYGSVTELNAQVHNANESLRIVRSKADIAHESYRMLNNTIKRLDETVTEITTKLEETNTTMMKTNTSLSYVNNSINAMQSSFLFLNDELKALEASLQKIENRMSSFGSAFPHISNVINDTRSALVTSKNNLADMDRILDKSNLTRDELVSKYKTLFREFSDVAETISNIGDSLNEMKVLSSDIHKESNTLRRAVQDAEDTYIRTKNNVKFINKTHEPITKEFKSLQGNKMMTNTSLNAVHHELEDIAKLLDTQNIDLQNYPNIDADIDIVIAAHSEQVLKLDDAKNVYDNWTRMYDNLDGILWDDKWFPTAVHVPYETLVNNTHSVNQTLNNYGNVLNVTEDMMKDMLQVGKGMRDHFHEIDKMKIKIDQIGGQEGYLTGEIEKTNAKLQSSDKNLTSLLSELKDKLDDVKLMESNYGDINGTYNMSMSFDELEAVLIDAIEDVQNAIQLLDTGKVKFGETVDTYGRINRTFHNTTFRLDPESSRVLNETLRVIDNTKGDIVSLNETVGKISNIIGKVHDNLDDVKMHINDLEDKLTYQKRKNNYVTKYHPILEQKFNDLFQRHNDTTSAHGKLLSFFEQLTETTKAIRNQSDNISNVDIDLSEEEKHIGQMTTEISNMQNKLKLAKHNLDQSFDTFRDYEESNRTFEDVKAEYKKYRKSITAFENVINKMKSNNEAMGVKGANISKQLDDIQGVLAEFIQLEPPVRKAQHTKNELTDKINETFSRLSQAVIDLQWLDDKFQLIRQNYSNFTATDIDLSETYVSEAINKTRLQLKNATEAFAEANGTALNLFSIIDETVKKYIEHNFDRTNIELIMNQFIKPNLDDILETGQLTHQMLDKIAMSVNKIDLSIKGVNDTIHITNQQLFEDRQKKLLADTAFPDLETETNRANNSIAATTNKINEQIESLQDVMKVYNDLTERLKNFPTVNISLGNESVQLLQFNQTLQNASERLIEYAKELKDINNTLWLNNDDRYSENETIDDMKTRFKLAEDKLRSLFEDIGNLESDLELAKNGTTRINNKMRALNDSLNRLEETNAILDTMLSEVSRVDGYLNETIGVVEQHENDLNKIVTDVNEIKGNFSGINKTVFNQEVGPIDSKIKTQGTMIERLNSKMSAVIAKITDAKKNLTKAFTNSQTTIDTPVDLDKIIQETKNVLSNVNSTVEQVIKSVDEVRDNAVEVKQGNDELVTDVTTMIDVFIRQQKLEYFNENFPKQIYDELNQTLLDTIGVETDIMSNLKSTFENFNKMNLTLGTRGKLAFDVSPYADTIHTSNVTLTNTSGALHELLDKYVHIEHLLHAKDGSLVSDNETLEEMKARYQQMYADMQDIQATLDDILQTFDNHNASLHKKNKEIESINSLIGDYDNIIGDVNKVVDQIHDWNTTVSEFDDNVNSHANQLGLGELAFETLNSNFSSVNNSMISNLTGAIADRVADLTALIEKAKIYGITLETNFNEAKTTIKQYTESLNAEQNDTEKLRDVLQLYPSINRTVSYNIDNMKAVNESSTINDDLINKRLLQLDEDLETLKRMYKEQEKLDYLEKHTHVLQRMLREAKMVINDTSSGIQSLNSSSDQVATLLRDVNQSMINDPSVIVPLTHISDDVKDWNDEIEVSQTHLKTLESIVGDTNIDTFMDNGIISVVNISIEQIKNTYESLNKTLNEVLTNASNIEHSVNELQSNANQREQWLDEISTDIEVLASLRNNVRNLMQLSNDTDKIVHETDDTLNSTGNKLSNLFNELHDMSVDFNSVKSDELKKTLQLFQGQTKDLLKKHKSINEIFNNTKQDYHIGNNDKDILTDLMNNVSYSTDDIKQKIKTGEMMHEKINETMLKTQQISQGFKNDTSLRTKAGELGQNIEELKKRFLEHQKLDYIREYAPIMNAKMNDTIKGLKDSIKDIEGGNMSKEVLTKLFESVQKIISDDMTIDIPLTPSENVIGIIKDNITSLGDFAEKLVAIYSELDSDILLEDGSYFTENETLSDVIDKFETLNKTLNELSENVSFIKRSINKTIDNINSESSLLDTLKTESEKLMEVQNQSMVVKDGISDVDRQLNDASSELSKQERSIISMETTLEELVNNVTFLNDKSLNELADAIKLDLGALHDQYKTKSRLLNETEDDFYFVQMDNKALDKVMSNTSKTVNDLQERSREASSLLQHMSTEMSIVNKSLDEVNRDTALKDRIQDMQRQITDLREKILQQEKLEYVQEHAPILKQKIFEALESIQRTQEETDKVNASGDALGALLEQVKDKTESETSIKIPLNAVSEKIENVKQKLPLINQLANLTSREILGIDINMLSEDGSYYNRNDSLADIIDEYGAVNDLLEKAENNVTYINATSKEAVDALETQQAMLQNVLGETERFIQVKRQVNTTTNQLQKLGDTKVAVQQASGDLLKQIMNLNATLDNVTTMYRDVKDNDLHNESSLLMKLITNLHGQYLETVTSPLNETNHRISKENETWGQLIERIDNEVNTVKELENKTNTANSTALEISENISNLENSFEMINRTVADKALNISALEKNINDLRDRFKKQQIYDYIKENFPTLLEKMNHVNKSLTQLDEKLPKVNSSAHQLEDGITLLSERLAEMKQVNIPLDDQVNKIDVLKDAFIDAADKKVMLEQKFKTFHDIISSNIDSNETLEDIKTRFEGYEAKLHTMVDNLNNIKDDLNNTNLGIGNMLSQFDSHHEIINTFNQVNSRVEERKSQWSDEIPNFQNVSKNLQRLQGEFDVQTNYLNDTVNRFKSVNDTELFIERLTIDERIANDKNNLDLLIGKFNRTNNEFKEFEEAYTNATTKLNKTKTTFHELETASNEVEEILNKTLSLENDTKETLKTNITTGLLSTEHDLANITELIENLRSKYLEKEKLEFVKIQIQNVNEQDKELRQSIKDTKELITGKGIDVRKLNKTRQNVQEKINTRDNLQFSTEDSTTKIIGMETSIADENENLDADTNNLDQLAVSKLPNKNWENMTLDNIKSVFRDLKNNLTDVNSSISVATTTVDDLEVAINQGFDDLNRTNERLDTYFRLEDVFADNEKQLDDLSNVLNDTKEFLTNTSNLFKTNSKRLENLTAQYPGVSNSRIDETVKMIKGIHGKVNLRLPLASKIFQRRFMENYDIVSERFDDITDVLFGNFTTEDGFDNILGDVEDSLMNVTVETEGLIDNNKFYHEDSKQLLTLVNNSTALLDKLEEYLQNQAKYDLLNANLPQLKNEWKRLSETNKTVKSDLSNSTSHHESLTTMVNNIATRMENMPAVDIPTNSLSDDLKHINNDTNNLRDKASKLDEQLSSIPIFDIDISALATNSAVSVLDVQGQLQNLNNDLQALDMDFGDMKGQVELLNTNLSEIHHHTNLLNDTLNRYDDAKQKLNDLNDSIIISKEQQEEALTKLSDSETQLISYKDSLADLKTKYKEYKHDSTDVEMLLNLTEDTIVALQTDLSNVETVLADVQKEYGNMSARLHAVTNEYHVLNDSLNDIELDYPQTEAKLNNVDQILNEILSKIPNVLVQLADIDDQIIAMNNTLKAEHIKSSFIDKTMPVLEDKYKQTNKTFLLTNATLSKMANEITELGQFVEGLKHRMNDFSTVNISMTDIDNNVTYLENRLIIMQDHYNDVKEIVKTLTDDINTNNIFGRNITLVDAKDQYTNFNGSLDRINEILSKINEDAAEAGEHFDFLNTTAKNMDKALDVFEEKSLNVKTMEKDVDVLGKLLADTNTDINEMDKAITNLSKSFYDMKLQYSDVFDYTAENNSVVSRMLETTNKSLSDLKQVLNSLGGNFKTTVNDFVDMNGTLFESIATYSELNDTLGNVKDKYVSLSKTINKLEHSISTVNEDTEGTNSSLSQLASMLRDLNETLNREQEKFDFIKNNLGGLEAKFQALKTPIETTNGTLNNVSAKVNMVEKDVNKVSNKLQQFKNIRINLDDEVVQLQNMNDKIADSKALLSNFSNSIDVLETKMKSLNDRTKNITEIALNYEETDTSLDGLQNNLTNLLSVLEDIHVNADVISNKTNKLDAALNELSVLDKSSSVVNGSLDTLGREINETGSTIDDIKTNTDGLFDAIRQMENMYSGIENEDLKKNLTDLLAKLNETNLAVNDANKKHQARQMNHSMVFDDLKNIQNNIHGEIRNQSALDIVTRESKGSLDNVLNDTSLLIEKQNAATSDVFNLMNEVESLTNQLNKLNETMAEEKRKQDFMEENFPHINTRYNTLNTAIGTMNGSINDASRNVNTVSKTLVDVKKRLDAIKAISIPLDAEEEQVSRIQQKVKNIMEEYKNVSQTYKQLKMSELQDKQKSLKELKVTYNDYNSTFTEMEKTLDRMNTDIKDLNISAGAIDESMGDISFTVNEYIESGEKISNITASGKTLTDSLKSTNESVSKMSSKLQNLNESLENLLANFSHIDDPEIKKSKDLLKTLFLASKEKINDLEHDIGNLHGANQDSHGLISNMNDTHASTKTALDQLKQHIKQINETSQDVEANFRKIDSQRAGINNNTDNLNPELEKLLDKINDLANNFLKEQEKIDVIASNKPILEARLKNITDSLAATNGHISLTEVKLADLKYEIKTTGTRLGRFKTINITTDKETKEWEAMNSTVMDLAKNFTRLSDAYQALQNEMKTINDRSITKAEIDKKLKSMNETLSTMEDGLSNINVKLKKTESEIEVTKGVLQGFSTSMDNFKLLQTETAKVETTAKETIAKMDKLQSISGGITQDIATLDSQVKDMNALYAPLKDKTWTTVKGKITKGLSTISQNVGKVNKTVQGLDKRLNAASTKLDGLVTTSKNKIMTRDNIDTSVTSLRTKVKQVGSQLSNLQTPVKTQNRQLVPLQTSVNKIKSTLNRLNSTLYKDLLKHNYVKENLPTLQGKHAEANMSFIANTPDMDNMKGQIAHLVSIITKIKDKMAIFGLEDTDLSMQNWDAAIEKLNNTMTMIVKKNKETSVTLSNLKQTLWSKTPMYTRKQTLNDVKKRFGNINKTLDDIQAASHTIKVSLNDVSAQASDVIMQLNERDSILTTTPATTTPSGPPDWLTMDSTVVGVIGKDPAFVECSAGDLTEWQMMVIKRINRDGIEENIAGWKLGVGARKGLRDKRFHVKKITDTNGGRLTVNINTLQCEDEGAYYCSIDSYNMWPLETTIDVTSPPVDDIQPDFPTEVFEDKITNFSCTGHPGYPNGHITWMVKHDHDANFRPMDFYSSKRKISDAGCVRTETNIVEYQFNMTWNNTRVRCYIENTDYYAEGKVQLLPYDICNRVRYLGTISHPYTPHKYIVCGKELNIMQCPGDTCYDVMEENCIQCKAGHGVGGDPCRGKPDYTYVAHEYDCKKYYLCLGKTKTPKKCAKGYFNPQITGNCVLSYAQSLCGVTEG